MNARKLDFTVLMLFLLGGLLATSAAESGSRLREVSFSAADVATAREAVREALGVRTCSVVRESLFRFEEGEGYLYVCHFDWDVVLAVLTPKLACRDVDHRFAKCGFAVDREDARTLRVTLRKHPGTGMFYEQALTVSVNRGRLHVHAGETTDSGPDFPW